MRRSIFTMVGILLFSSVVFLSSCTNKDEDPAPPEFIADDNTFANFSTWKLEASNNGPDPALGAAHAGNDSTVTRDIYFKDGQNPQSGVYPLESVIVKESMNPDKSVHELTAMVKRGNNFNPDNGDWEWFMLNADGTIADGGNARGANLMNGMCNACHKAAATDMVFTK